VIEARRGMSMIEVLVAVSMLAIVVSSLGLLSVGVAHSSFRVSGRSFVNAELTRQVNRLVVLPFDSLPRDSGTTTITSSGTTFTRQMQLDSIGPLERRVHLMLTPANTLFRPETVVFNRSRPAGSPLAQ
jgi:prepilin-type N-terminal cleavage/methylation domain-containing protein